MSGVAPETRDAKSGDVHIAYQVGGDGPRDLVYVPGFARWATAAGGRSWVVALTAPGEVLVSSTVKDLVAGSGLRFRDRGSHVLRGVPGTWQLFAAEPEGR